jgi:hypothetical protein
MKKETMKFKIIDNLEESDLIEFFSEDSYSDPDLPSKLYDYSALPKLSKDKIVNHFIEEVLEGDSYENLNDLSVSKVSVLLRQMAMFRKKGNKKIMVNPSTDAKQYTRELIAFLGPKTVCYTNVDSIDNPHDKPSLVIRNTYCYEYFEAICFIAVNEKYLLFIEQRWNFGGE